MNLTGQQPYQKTTAEERGLDKLYQAWCRLQPSAMSGKRPCVYAHYRTAANAGTGIKPIFSGIPLTREEHDHQTHIGQFNFQPREWWEEQVKQHLAKWRKSCRVK